MNRAEVEAVVKQARDLLEPHAYEYEPWREPLSILADVAEQVQEAMMALEEIAKPHAMSAYAAEMLARRILSRWEAP